MRSGLIWLRRVSKVGPANPEGMVGRRGVRPDGLAGAFRVGRVRTGRSTEGTPTVVVI